MHICANMLKNNIFNHILEQRSPGKLFKNLINSEFVFCTGGIGKFELDPYSVWEDISQDSCMVPNDNLDKIYPKHKVFI